MHPIRPGEARDAIWPNGADSPIGPAHGPAKTYPPAQGTLPSEALLGGRKTVNIEHNGTVYRLQSTRAGKLILTK